MKRKIKVNDYYGTPAYYSVMPQEIFNALELAALQGKRHVKVDRVAFDNMIAAYKAKSHETDGQPPRN